MLNLHAGELQALLTGYSDLDAAVAALNSGGIFRYLRKPRDQQEMAFTLRQPAQIVTRLAQVPREAREREKVGSLLGMLGRLRERLTA